MSIFLISGVATFIYYSSLKDLIPIPISIISSILGLLCFLISKWMLSNKKVYQRKRKDKIILSTPLAVDLLFIFGTLVLFFSILTFRYMVEYLANESFLLGAIILFVMGNLMWLGIRMRYALNDRIVISKEKIIFDDPLSNEITELNSVNIDRIIFLKCFSLSRNGYSSSSYTYDITIYSIDSSPDSGECINSINAENMHLNYPAVALAFTEMGYEVLLRSKKENEEEEWDGHEFR